MESLTEAFAAEVARRGDATAMHWQGRCITLAEIDAASDRAARGLLSRGLAAEAPVGVILPRGPEQIVAVMGILKAGGAYLPLDPAYPAERMAWILSDAGCDLVIDALERPLAADSRPPGAARVTMAELDQGKHFGGPIPRVPADRLAYVIYTSGSTGQPKGVEVPHAGLVMITRAGAANYRRLGAARLYQFFGMGFDVWGYEVFMALLGGLELVSDPDGPAALPPDALFARLAELQVDAVITTPSYMSRLTRIPAQMPGIVTVCGEACPAELVRLLRPHCTVMNGYGPTEVTVACATGVIEDKAPPIALGRPYDHLDVLILDPGGRPLQAGETGEIAVAGHGLARGYRGRPDLTAARFVHGVSDRFPGAPMYLTGDLGRLRPDGQLDFMGRLDDQIKVRGYRVEPGEIEARIGAFPGVRGAAVVSTGTSIERRLTGFVAGGPTLDLKGLRTDLEAVFPPWMLPARLERLDAFPTLPSGKADRRRLAAMAEALAPPQDAAAAVTAADDPLALAWAKALAVPSVGEASDFFELGGDSLVAAAIISAAEATHGGEIPLRLLYDNPTLAGFRCALTAREKTG